MRCSEFLDRYTDFKDGTVTDPVLRLRLKRHLARCRSCTRYDVVMARGVAVLKQSASVEPTQRFRVRVRCRIAIDSARRQKAIGRRARIAGSVMVTAAVVLVAIERMAIPEETEVATAPAPEPTLPVVTSTPGYPFVTFVDMSVPAFRPAYNTDPWDDDDSVTVSPPRRVNNSGFVLTATNTH